MVKTANEDEFDKKVDSAISLVTQIFNPTTTSFASATARSIARMLNDGSVSKPEASSDKNKPVTFEELMEGSQSPTETFNTGGCVSGTIGGSTYPPYIYPQGPYQVPPVTTPSVTVTTETGTVSEVTDEGNAREEALLTVIAKQREVIQALNALIDQLLDTK